MENQSPWWVRIYWIGFMFMDLRVNQWKAYREIYQGENLNGKQTKELMAGSGFFLMQISWNFQIMQFGTWPFADSNPTISPFFLQPSVVQLPSSFRPFVEETVQTENSASVFSGASFWNYAERLWHCWPPFTFDGYVKCSYKRAAHQIYGPPR